MVELIYSKAQKKEVLLCFRASPTKHHKLKIALAIPLLPCAASLLRKTGLNPLHVNS